MIKVIGVRFRTAGKIYFFDPCEFEIKRGDHVIVETARGIEFGTVVAGVKEVEDDKVIQPLKPVLRIATPRDIEQEAANKEREREAFKVCLEKIRKHELDMKLIDAEYTFDNNKVLFYFTADGRIDFRELVKDLAGVFKTRIELRQIGVRDETKIVGGIGICGRPLCCHSYLSDFIPVSIKMAKEQNLSLNPTKISGVCGRLMCCLKNEEETYEELNRRLPGIGDYVTTEDGLKGEVQSVNVLRQLVKVVVEDGDAKEIKEYPVDQLSFRRKGGKKEKIELSKEELQELARLEEEEMQDGEGKSEGNQRQSKNRLENHNRQDGDGRGRNDRNRQEGEGRNRNDRNRQEGEGRNRSDKNRQNDRNNQHSHVEGNAQVHGDQQSAEEVSAVINDLNTGELSPENRGENGQRQEGEGRNRNDRNRNRNRNRNRQHGDRQGSDDQNANRQNTETVNDENPNNGNGQRQEGEGRNRHHRNRNRHNRYRNDKRQEGQSKPNDSQS